MKLPFKTKNNKDISQNNDCSEQENFCDDQYSDQQPIPGLSDLYVPQKSIKTESPVIPDGLNDTPDQPQQLENSEQQYQQNDECASDYSEQNSPDEHRDMEFKNIESADIDTEAFEMLDIEFIKSNAIMPIAIEEDTLVVATSQPENILAQNEVKRLTNMNIRLVVCPADDIEIACEKMCEEKIDYCVDELISDMDDIEVVIEEEEECEDLENIAAQSPVIKFVNYLISNAIHQGASDIHIEPKVKKTKIRYRIDGVLFQSLDAPSKMHPAIVSRIKIMSNLDISERRTPQDGKVSVIVGGRGVDLRVSILPTNHGEKVVIRILDSKSIMRGLENLGMEQQTTEAFKQQIAQPHGILLVTGPTGSGKSTTLYSALNQMDGETLNISTVEDPVEYELDFCNQIQVLEKIGMDFASALRSLLRQDPDIIMIGEIRDHETAKIAVQAALTGHLVLSTLHTNDAPSSITRLINIGVDSYLIAASLNAVLAQRLVRRICPNCKEQYQPPEHLLPIIEKAGGDPNQLYHGAGCEKCRESGYAGRVGIYELLIVDDKLRNMINKDASVSNMRKAFRKSDQPSLFDDGLKKVMQGLTTFDEVLRVAEIIED
jgi:type IV pilus assembly protein PilB